jgi:hypothetical protein
MGPHCRGSDLDEKNLTDHRNAGSAYSPCRRHLLAALLKESPMSSQDCDPLRRIAGQVAYCFAERGYAFIEDDKIEGLAALLGSFLTVAGIPVNPLSTDDPAPARPPKQPPIW